MTIIFFFVHFFLFLFLILMVLFIPDNNACHRWPSKLKHLSSCKDFLKGLTFGPKLFRSFLSKERIMAQKCFWKMGNFGQHAPRHQSKMISRYHGLGTLFCSLKRFGRFKTVASHDAYQITKYQFFQNSSFFVAWFSKNSRRVSESRILRPIAWVSVIKRFIRFFKIVPLGTPRFSKDSKVEESVY